MIAGRLWMVYDGRKTSRVWRGDEEREQVAMKIWTSSDTEGKEHYALRMVGGILGIVLLALILICAGIYVGFHEKWRMEEVSLVLCLGVTAICVGLAYWLGQQSWRNRLIFCLDDEDRLFMVEAGKYIRVGSGLAAYISLASGTQKEIRELTAPGGLLERGMRRAGSLTGQEPQIVSVEQIRERERSYRVVCHLKYPNQREGKRTYSIVKGYEDEDGLMWELERRRKS